MRYRFFAVLLPAYIAGAAQLGQVKASSSGGVMRALIPVTGKFNFSKAQLADRIYFDLPDVAAASSGTQRIAIHDAVVTGVRIAGRGAGTRIVFDLNAPADLTVSQSASGLSVEIRPAAKTAAKARPSAHPKAALSRKHPRPADSAVIATDLRDVPELPTSFVVQTRPAEPSGPVAAPLPAPVRAVAAAAVAPPPDRSAERELFGDSTSDPAFPAVDEANVEAPADVAVFAVEDKAQALQAALRTYNGFFAFGSANNPGYATFLFHAADLSRVDLPVGLAALGDYRVFRLAATRYAVIEELRRKYSIDPALNAYAVFPDAFDRVLLPQIRSAAARSGRAGRVIAARIAFSIAAPSRVEVLQVRVRPASAQ